MQYNGNAYFGKEGAAGRGEMDRSSMCDDRSASRESGRILPAKGLLLVCLVPVLGLWPGPASAEEKKTPEPGFVEQIETELKQAAVKVNDAEWLAPDRLLILEQGGDLARLVVVELSAAGNLGEGMKEDALAPERSGTDLTKLPVAPATVTVWATISGLGDEGTKLEGLAVLSPTEIAIASDNDFGLGESAVTLPSTVWRLRLSRPLPLAR